MATPNNIQVILSAQDKASPVITGLRRSLDGLQGGLSRVSGILSTLGIATGVGVAGLVALAKSSIDFADSLNDMSDRTGVTVKDLASLELAAKLSDTSLEGVAKGIQRITLSIGQGQQGNKQIVESLTRLGVTSTDSRERLFQLADAYVKTSDKTKLMADLQAVLGKSYVELLPLLKQGGDELRRLASESETYGETLARLAPDAAKFNDMLDEMKQEAALASLSFMDKLVPSLIETTRRVRELMDDDKGLTAMVRLLAGLGKVPWDIIFPTPGLTETSAQRIAELNKELYGLQKTFDRSKRHGKLVQEMIGTPEEIQAQMNVIKNQIIALEKFGDKIYKPKPVESKAGRDEVLQTIIVRPKVKLPKWEEVFTKAEFNRAQLALAASGALSFSFITNDKQVADFIRDQYAAVNDMQGEIASDAIKRLADDTAWAAEEAAHLADTWGAVNRQSTEWIEAGRALTAEMMTPIEQMNTQLAYMNELFARGAISAETLDRATAKLFDDNAPKIEKAKSLAEELGLTFTSAFEDAIVNGEKFSDVLQAIESDIIKLLVRMSVTEPLMNSIKSSFGSGGFDIGSIATSFFGSLFGSAKGNVFNNAPALSAYSGSIVSQPTVFPFAAGIGLMGEAGPEAILPLKRGAGGKLGVEGGSSVQVNVINNASGTTATANEPMEGGTRIIDVMIEQVKSAIAGDFTRGGPVAMAAERTYGLSRAPGAY